MHKAKFEVEQYRYFYRITDGANAMIASFFKCGVLFIYLGGWISNASEQEDFKGCFAAQQKPDDENFERYLVEGDQQVVLQNRLNVVIEGRLSHMDEKPIGPNHASEDEKPCCRLI